MEAPIWQYKEFWTLIITQVIAAVTFFGGRYLAPEDFEIALFLTGMFETVGLFFAGVFATRRLRAEVASDVEYQVFVRGRDR